MNLFNLSGKTRLNQSSSCTRNKLIKHLLTGAIAVCSLVCLQIASCLHCGLSSNSCLCCGLSSSGCLCCGLSSKGCLCCGLSSTLL